MIHISINNLMRICNLRMMLISSQPTHNIDYHFDWYGYPNMQSIWKCFAFRLRCLFMILNICTNFSFNRALFVLFWYTFFVKHVIQWKCFVFQLISCLFILSKNHAITPPHMFLDGQTQTSPWSSQFCMAFFFYSSLFIHRVFSFWDL